MIDYTDDIIDLIEKLENPKEKISMEEQIVLDVIEIANILDTDGLFDFWFSSINPDSVMKSLDVIGAAELIDTIQASQWCQEMAEDQSDFTESEQNHLAEIEEPLPDLLNELPELLQEFYESEIAE